MGEETEVSKLYYDYETLTGDLQHIVRDMSVAQYKPDVIVGPGRGAYFPGVMLSHYFDVPFEGFRWQTRDGLLQDESKLSSAKLSLSQFSEQGILSQKCNVNFKLSLNFFRI